MNAPGSVSVDVTAGAGRPSGTVTLAFTDIEGSTVRWERNRAAMQAAVRRHDAIVREAIVERGGYVFKTIGDAFCAAFHRPEDAIGAMLDAQLALVREDFSAVDGVRVRAAIHSGTADERDGDYFGPTVNRVARLLAIGNGGQVLVSGATADLARATLPAQTSLRDLGDHRLKDLTRPERVFDLLAPGLPSEFLPLRSLDTLPHNFPREITSFVGREREIGEIATLLATNVLVTLVGSGGIGKTRVSLHVAAQVLDDFPDGVWFVELAPLASGDYVASAIAQAVGVLLGGEGEPIVKLASAIASKRLLLVLDNCEHLLDAVAATVSAIVRRASGVKVLASTRQALGLAGEQAYRIAPLQIPSTRATISASEALRSEAVALFVDRARAIDPRFALTDDGATVVLDICRRLDGIPLAIELAAVRVKILSPRQLRERLDERFRVLTGGSRDALPRQQTLRALIDWSHDLLDERERALFRRLGTFVDGFTLEAAAAVGSGDDLDEFEAFDVLASLVDKSLVLAEPAGDDLRYRLLESTRAYAREKLVAAAEIDTCRERHLRYVHDRALVAYDAFERTISLGESDRLLAMELEDVRAALEFSVRERRFARLGGELLYAFGRSWQNLGLQVESIARCEALLSIAPSDDPALAAKLEICAMRGAYDIGRKEYAHEIARRAVTHARMSDSALLLVNALICCVHTASSQGDLSEADALLGEAEAIRELPPATKHSLLSGRAFYTIFVGDNVVALAAFYDARRIKLSVGGTAFDTTSNIAEVLHISGRTLEAIDESRALVAQIPTSGLDFMRWCAMSNLTAYLAWLCDPGALAVGRGALAELARAEPAGCYAAILVEHLALAFSTAGDDARAAALAGYADVALAIQKYVREPTERMTYERVRATLATRLEPDELARQLAKGAALAPEAAIALALAE